MTEIVQNKAVNLFGILCIKKNCTYAANCIFIHRQSWHSFRISQSPCNNRTALCLSTNIWITNRNLNNWTVGIDLNVLQEASTLQQSHTPTEHLNNVTTNVAHMNCRLSTTESSAVDFIDFSTSLKYLFWFLKKNQLIQLTKSQSRHSFILTVVDASWANTMNECIDVFCGASLNTVHTSWQPLNGMKLNDFSFVINFYHTFRLEKGLSKTHPEMR